MTGTAFTGEGWQLTNMDCVEGVAALAEHSVDLSVYSPPFVSLYGQCYPKADPGAASAVPLHPDTESDDVRTSTDSAGAGLNALGGPVAVPVSFSTRTVPSNCLPGNLSTMGMGPQTFTVTAGQSPLTNVAAVPESAVPLPPQAPLRALIERLRSRAMIEAPPDNEPDTRAAFEDVPEITFDELREICGLLTEASDALDALLSASSCEAPATSFQTRVRDWLFACFGEQIATDKAERVHRFIEEALELAQSLGCTSSEARQLVEYVFSRPIGEPVQEVGGTMTTLAALCFAHGFDMITASESELLRCWTKIDTIRAKQKAKPKHSPLPSAPSDEPTEGKT